MPGRSCVWCYILTCHTIYAINCARCMTHLQVLVCSSESGSSSSGRKRLPSTGDESKSSSSSNSSQTSNDSSGSSGSSSLSTDSSKPKKTKAARQRSDQKAKKATAGEAKKGRGRGRGRNGRGKAKGVASQPDPNLPEPTESPRKFARLQPAVISLELDSDWAYRNLCWSAADQLLIWALTLMGSWKNHLPWRRFVQTLAREKGRPWQPWPWITWIRYVEREDWEFIQRCFESPFHGSVNATWAINKLLFFVVWDGFRMFSKDTRVRGMAVVKLLD